jgi:hypothetical protein
MGGEFISTRMGRLTKGSGRKINSMDMEWRSGLIRVSMRDIISWARNMDKVERTYILGKINI